MLWSRPKEIVSSLFKAQLIGKPKSQGPPAFVSFQNDLRNMRPVLFSRGSVTFLQKIKTGEQVVVSSD